MDASTEGIDVNGHRFGANDEGAPMLVCHLHMAAYSSKLMANSVHWCARAWGAMCTWTSAEVDAQLRRICNTFARAWRRTRIERRTGSRTTCTGGALVSRMPPSRFGLTLCIFAPRI
jgi:hypothetical protein